jgi:exopolysaccharide biosynthesis polyprenyl glycosylphosphotransferase
LGRGYHRLVTTGTIGDRSAREDVRAVRPYLLSASPLKTLARRAVSIVVLVAIDVGGLMLGLYAALALRSELFDPKPILWGLLWEQEADWLAFLILLLLVVFWRGNLYAPRELREGAGRVVPSVFLVAALSLAFAIGTGQHFTTFGLYVVGAVFVALLIGVFRASYELLTGTVMRGVGIRRKAVLVGAPDERAHLRRSLGTRRGGIDYAFVGEVDAGPGVEGALAGGALDELIVSDVGVDDARMLEIVEAAHRRGVRVRVAPRTAQLLVERGEYVPGQGLPLFELRPPIFAGAQWVAKRSFDVVLAGLLVVCTLPLWVAIAIAIKLGSHGPVLYSDPRIGLGERPFRMRKFRTMVEGARAAQARLESANEASGPLFKIRDDPRVTRVGRVLRRLSLDEMPNLLNVLRGEMSLVGPRPLPVRDVELMGPWHRRRSNVLPGMTGLWQVAGRSDLSFDDLVRLDFYYIENWSIWLDLAILFKTPLAVFAQRGAY